MSIFDTACTRQPDRATLLTNPDGFANFYPLDQMTLVLHRVVRDFHTCHLELKTVPEPGAVKCSTPIRKPMENQLSSSGIFTQDLLHWKCFGRFKMFYKADTLSLRI